MRTEGWNCGEGPGWLTGAFIWLQAAVSELERVVHFSEEEAMIGGRSGFPRNLSFQRNFIS